MKGDTVSTPIIHFSPPLIVGRKGDRCGACNRQLQACMCQLQADGALWCLVCIGKHAALPAEVVETLKQMEREHGRKK